VQPPSIHEDTRGEERDKHCADYHREFAHGANPVLRELKKRERVAKTSARSRLRFAAE
jgi:hypothetical protein